MSTRASVRSPGSRILGALLPILAFAMPSGSIAAQRLLREVVGGLGSRYGSGSVSPAGDVDTDGKPDYLVAAPGEFAVRLVSGHTGAVLRSFAIGGAALCNVLGGVDIDQDGKFDIAIAEPLATVNGRTEAGRVRVFDTTGRLLFERSGQGTRDYYGHSIAFWRNGLVVGAPQGRSRPLAVGAGYVQLLDAAGGVMATRNGVAGGDLCGFAVAVTGSGTTYDPRSFSSTTTVSVGIGRPGVAAVDMFHYSLTLQPGRRPTMFWFVGATVTGPAQGNFGFSLATVAPPRGGHGNLLVGNFNQSHGEVRLLSGIGLTELRRHAVAPYTEQYYGTQVASAGDVNGDGVCDYMIGSGGHSTAYTDDVVNLHSGANGTLLYRFQSRVGRDGVGAAMAPLGDLDGDGLGDVLIGLVNSAAPFPNNYVNGALRIHAGSRWWFTVPNQVAAAQGPVRLTANALPGTMVAVGIGTSMPSGAQLMAVTDAQGAASFAYTAGGFRGSLQMQAMFIRNGSILGVSPVEFVQVY